MRFASLGSGSKGNSTLVQQNQSLLMIDNGFSIKETEKRLATLDVQAEQITAILVTHEHADHMGGVSRFAKRYAIPVYTSYGTAKAFKDDDIQCFNGHESFRIGDIDVTPIPVPHDASEPTQFTFAADNSCFGVLTDAGSVTEPMVSALKNCDALLLECNYDHDMLMNGPYPAALKQRVAGDWGHLSNQQAAQLLKKLPTEQLEYLVLAHVSENNNTPDKVLDCISAAMDCDRAWLKIIDQYTGLDWLTITPKSQEKERSCLN